jgi:CBS domain-containing protein
VYDYVGGKLDWLAAGLASEGTNATRPRAGDVARREVPTCGLGHDEQVQRVMRPGPSTFRPHVPLDDILKFMVAHDLFNTPITTSDGKLVGLIRREDVAHSGSE